jgi:putative periplasmic protein
LHGLKFKSQPSYLREYAGIVILLQLNAISIKQLLISHYDLTMKQSFHALAASLLMFAAASGAQASSKIYTCTVNGEVVYTSRPSGNCHSADLPTIGKYSSTRYDAPALEMPEPAAEAPSKRAGNAKPAPKNTAKANPAPAPIRPAPEVAATPAPKSSGSTSRRSILETELSNERKALGEAQKSLAQARVAKGGHVNQQEINSLQSAVLDRQQNIQALQRELSRM